MPRFTQHPDLNDALAQEFREKHLTLFDEADFIATNNGQIVKSFSRQGEEFVIKRYPEKGPRANLRSLLGISRAMNSFKKSALLRTFGVESPIHLFVARYLGVMKGESYLIMRKSRGTSLQKILSKPLEAPFPDRIITNLAEMTNTIHTNGLTHGDLHAGNIFILENHMVEVIDLDNMRPSPGRQQKDRERLLRSFDGQPELQQKLTLAITPIP